MDTLNTTLSIPTKQDVRMLLQALQKLQQEGYRYARWGICANLGYYEPEVKEYWLKLAFPSWTEYSGNVNYPIEGSERQYNRHINKWDIHATHGPARNRLLKHCIEYFSNYLESM